MLSTVASSLTSPGQKGGGVWPDGTRCSHCVKRYCLNIVRHLTSGYSPHGKEGGREGGREREGGRGREGEGGRERERFGGFRLSAEPPNVFRQSSCRAPTSKETRVSAVP